jgi:hypothetical protein
VIRGAEAGSDDAAGEAPVERAGTPDGPGVTATFNDAMGKGVPEGLAVGAGVPPEAVGGVGAIVDAGVTVGRAVGTGVGRGVTAGVGGGVGAGVGGGVGAGVGGGVGAGVGGGVEVPLTVKVRPTVGNWPEPHLVDPAEPGLSNAVAVQDIVPAAGAVPATRNVAESPTGNPTSGLSSEGFLNAIRVVPPDVEE